MVIRVMETLLRGLSWVGSPYSEFSFRIVAYVILLLLKHIFWILLNFYSVLLKASWCALVSFLVTFG